MMGSLLSIPLSLTAPLLSFLAIPAFSSSTTSLNLLFFSMTWITLLLAHGELKVEALGTLFVRVIFYVLPSLVALLFDIAMPSLTINVKAQGEVALPSRYGGRRVARVVATSVFNVLLGVALQAGVEVLFTDVIQIRSALKIAKTLPMPWGVAKDLLKGFMLRNIIQYYIHRYVLHAPNSRLPIARWHQTWHHSLRAPYSFVANYDHPVAWLLWRWLPVYLPAILFRFHVLTFYLLLALVSLEEAVAYSGYGSSVLPSTIVLTGMARRQDEHMMSEGKGNFAPWGLLDWMHGTTVGKDVMEDVRKEMDKHDVHEKAGNAMDGAESFLDDAGKNVKERARGKGRNTKD